jgi:hypothetical protein
MPMRSAKLFLRFISEPRIFRKRRPTVAPSTLKCRDDVQVSESGPSLPPLRFRVLRKFLPKGWWIFGHPFLRLNMCLSRQQPIYRLAKLLADCQKNPCAWFFFSPFQS